jgi:hypothetical protein
MARPRRVHQPGGMYYAVLVGNGKRPIFFDDADKAEFLKLLLRAAERCQAELLAYSLTMRDARILIRISSIPLGRVVQRVNSFYSRTVHVKYGSSGYLFQHPYRAHLLEGTQDPDTYPWSSHRAHLGLEEVSGLALEPVAKLLDPTLANRRGAYEDLMRGLRSGAVYGDDSPPDTTAPGDDRFFRLASSALDQTAESSHSGSGHRGRHPENECRSAQADVALARAAAGADARTHRMACHSQWTGDPDGGRTPVGTRPLVRLHGVRALPGLEAPALCRHAGGVVEGARPAG